MGASVFNDNRSARADVQSQINITPLVDVMLVLLVIFMVTAPALARRADVTLPQAGPTQPDPPEVAVLEVDARGGWRLDGVAMSPRETEAQLHAVVERAPGAVLRVQAEGGADYQSFVSALAMADASGMRHVVTDPR